MLVIYNKPCRWCQANLEFGLWACVPNFTPRAGVECPQCGRRMTLSFFVLTACGFVAILFTGIVMSRYFHAIGPNAGPIPFFLGFPIGMALFFLTCMVLGSACYLAYSRFRATP